MKLIVFILLITNLTFADSGVWVSVRTSTPTYKTVERVIPKRVCREYRGEGHHSKIVKRCKKVEKVVYKEVFDGYKNRVHFKSNGRKHELKFKSDKRINRVKIGILDYR